MLNQTLKTLFTRDLTKLKAEIALYKIEANIWRIDKDILNSAGNLCLHLVGNLNLYIGAELGGVAYIRNRPAEFSLKDIPREELIRMIDQTIVVLEKALDGLSEQQLQSEYPLLVLESRTSTEYFLVHLATHLSYHLGQVNYHRRMLDF